MKILKHLLLIILLWPTLSKATPLITPDKVLEQAALGRNELREVVMSLNFNTAEMRDVQTFESYFFLLDDLQKIAIENGFEDLYPGVIETLGNNFTSQGIRWLSIINSSESKLIYYVKWMNSAGVGRFLSLAEYELKDIKNPDTAKSVSKNVDAILPLIEKTSANIPYIILGFNKIKSDTSVTLLKMETLTDIETAQWISKVSLSSSMSEYLDHLNRDIYSTSKANISKSHQSLFRLQTMLNQCKNLRDSTPGWLTTAIGDSIAEVLSSMIKHEELFLKNELESTLPYLSNRQLEGVSMQLMNLQKPPTKDYITEFVRIANLIIKSLSSRGQTREADELKKSLAKTSAPVVAQKYNIEGHYKVTNKTNKIYYFTIATSRENSLVAAFVDEQFNIVKSLYNVTYNSFENLFIASEREPDLDHHQNLSVKFAVTEDGGITILDPYVREGGKDFYGKKIQSIPDLWKNAESEVTNAQGTYTGELTTPTGSKTNIRLIVTSFNGYTVGRIESGNLTIDLNIGSSGTDGVLILTSGRTFGGSWFQLRSNVVKGGLQASVLIGGRGLSKTSSFLKKISN